MVTKCACRSNSIKHVIIIISKERRYVIGIIIFIITIMKDNSYTKDMGNHSLILKGWKDNSFYGLTFDPLMEMML